MVLVLSFMGVFSLVNAIHFAVNFSGVSSIPHVSRSSFDGGAGRKCYGQCDWAILDKLAHWSNRQLR